MNTLILVRGLPGSGKTTFVANMMTGDSFEFSADYFMYADGQEFDPARLAECHKKCQDAVRAVLSENSNATVFVHNTFTQTWEMEPYFEIAGKTDTLVHTIVVENRHGNNSVHDVPDGTMSRMRQRFDVSL